MALLPRGGKQQYQAATSGGQGRIVMLRSLKFAAAALAAFALQSGVGHRAGLAEQAGENPDRVRRRRRHRRRDAHRRGRPVRNPGPAVHRREPARRRRHHRGRHGGARAEGRLHRGRAEHGSHGVGGDGQERAVRSGQRFRADRHLHQLRDRDRGRQEFAGDRSQESGRAMVNKEPGKLQLLDGRPGLDAASDRRGPRYSAPA